MVGIAAPSGSAERNTEAYRVMVVDDSAVIRTLLTRALEADPGIKVVASAGNGQRAIDVLSNADVDVVVLDIEMPVMDGITALPRLVAVRPGVQIVMASTLTRKNADISMRALAAGAADYIAKPGSTELRNAEDFNRELVGKVRALGQVARRRRGGAAVVVQRARPPVVPTLRQAVPHPAQVVVIGSSTGGPQALFQVLKAMPTDFPLPILIVQHMPPTFTSILAEHIAQSSGLPSAEGRDGEVIRVGRIYVAPGGIHMVVAAQGTTRILKLVDSPPENFCRPAVDPLWRSAAAVYGSACFAVMLTGMGQDGLKGAEAIVAAGGSVIAQDEATSVVWGMPGAVAKAGICSAVLPLSEISGFVRRVAMRTAA
jgi:two-component system, chemotaxis family, protein-glutamate methylesterase/glutaminase